MGLGPVHSFLQPTCRRRLFYPSTEEAEEVLFRCVHTTVLETLTNVVEGGVVKVVYIVIQGAFKSTAYSN